jgi:hypothetical protein
VTVDHLFGLVNEALEAHKFKLWVLLDRLDVAFTENHTLEANALRALLRVYGDIRGLDSISLKIFLREDIWRRVTEGGFREATHITKFVVLDWTPSALMNLIMRRVLNNDVIIRQFQIDREKVLRDSNEQEALFDRLFPPQVDLGKQKPTTFKWMVSRCADGTGKTAPRELILLLNSVRDEEIKRLEHGGTAPSDEELFDRSVFKLALPTVSRYRIDQNLYAEYPTQKRFIESLINEKTEQTVESLMAIWKMASADAIKEADALVEIGLFEKRGTRDQPTFWVPFLYRDALDLIQGRAEEE